MQTASSKEQEIKALADQAAEAVKVTVLCVLCMCARVHVMRVARMYHGMLHARMNVRMHLCMYACMHVCTHAPMYAYTYDAHTYIHTFIHAHRSCTCAKLLRAGRLPRMRSFSERRMLRTSKNSYRSVTVRLRV